MSARGIPVLIILAFSFAIASAADRYVAQAGQTPAGGYISWDTAATNIQEALSAAAVDETVWISNGTYTVGLSNQIVYINKGLKLRGFSGNRDDVILEGPARTDPSKSIRGIRVNSTTSDYILVDSITISNCTSSDAISPYGAGIYINQGSVAYPGTTEVRNCLIVNGTNTTSSRGGGSIYSGQAAGSPYYVMLTNCMIANNWSSNRNFAGGWLVNGRASVDNCIFAGNGITPNTDRGYGFGMGASGTVRNCRFENHSQGGATWGMAISLGKDVLMENCVVISNRGANSGGIYAESVTNVTIRNCLVSHNRASSGNGGGGYIWNASVNFENCTIVSNAPALAVRQTSAATTGICVFVNNIICSNTINFSSFSIPVRATNNCCSTDLGAYGPGNITASPRFVNFGERDLGLSSDSPCINQGYNLPWMDGNNDLDGRTRKDIFSGVVDMGCYEHLLRGVVFRLH